MPPMKSGLKTRPRERWGHGQEARLTAHYRRYEVGRSPIYRILQHQFPMVTAKGMCELIECIIASCPEEQRPRGPSRSQRRVKGGLVCWLDAHSAIAAKVLTRTQFWKNA
jgi:hypothetical protein